jgi:phage terminase large subunit-like protein
MCYYGTLDYNLNTDNSLPEFTKEEKSLVKQAARIALARTDLLAYNMQIDVGYEDAPHIKLLTGKLEAIERGDIKKLIVVLPFRHSKSETVSGKFPGWCLGRDPGRTFIIVGHNATLAGTFSTQNRDTIADNPKYREIFPDVVINPKRRGAEIWAVNNNRENVVATGMQGGIVGFGAWCLIIDDPFRTAEHAASPTYRDKVYQEYKMAARSRLVPNGRIIIVCTRWHEDDLIGRILSSPEADEWEVVHLPALSYGVEDDYRFEGQTEEEYNQAVETIPKTAFPDPLGRPKGEALWPTHYTKAFLLQTKLVLQHDFECAYQGNPTTIQGVQFQRQWFRGVTANILQELRVKPLVRARSYDLAWSAERNADYTVGLRGSIYVPDKEALKQFNAKLLELGASSGIMQPVLIVIEDVVRWKKEWNDSSTDIERLAITDGVGYDMIVEAVASQNLGFKSLRSSPRLQGHTLHKVAPDTDKELRSKYTLKLASLGCVVLLQDADGGEAQWRKDFLDEVCGFPYAVKDDQFDALTQFINYYQPVIDRVLLNITDVKWSTPFMEVSGNLQSARAKLPGVFQEVPTGEPRVDGLGWRF